MSLSSLSPQPFRGYLYDVVQGRTYDPLPTLYPLVRYLADCGLNQFVLYLDDLYRLKSHPELAHPHAYPMRDLVALADYARAQGIDMMPCVTTLGHSGAKLKRPSYRHLAFPGGGDFDVLNPAMYDLFADIFDEVFPLFPSDYAFINGDETSYTRLSPEARERARRQGLGALYGEAMGRLTRLALERGRRPIVWHDMLLHHPEAIDFLPRETVIAYWYYDAQTHVAIEYFCERGFDVVGAAGVLEAPALPAIARCTPSIRSMARAAHAHAVRRSPDQGVALGTLLTTWCGTDWRRTLVPIYATGRWTREPDLPVADMYRQFARDVFGADHPDLAAALADGTAEAARLRFTEEDLSACAEATARERLSAEVGRRRQRIQGIAAAVRGGQPPARPEELHTFTIDFAGEWLTPASKPAPTPAADTPRALYSTRFAKPGDHVCRLHRERTPYGHELVILTNGCIAVALLPEFGAAMIEWVILNEQPWNVLQTGYEPWAARQPRTPGDVGLGSPWGASEIGGWRETIFFNSRLNPCTLWGKPFEVTVVRQSDSDIVIACEGRSEAAEVRRTIGLRLGTASLAIETVATSLRDGFLAIRPNAVHALPRTPVPLLRLRGDGSTGGTDRWLIDTDARHFTPAGNEVRVSSAVNPHALRVRFPPEEIEQFLTDYGHGYFTLEPLGTIHRRARGESVRLRLEYSFGGQPQGDPCHA